MMKNLSYLFTLIAANLKSHISDKKKFLIMSSVMLIQNVMFFTIWIILFENVSHLKGWDLSDVSRMFGIVCLTFGLTNAMFAGMRTLPQLLQDGSFDAYISKPRHPLPPLICSMSSPTAVGDILFAPIVWFMWGDLSWSIMPMLILAVFISTAFWVSASVMIYTISLWIKAGARFPDQLFEALIISSGTVIHGQPFIVKAVAFTILPAGFINYLPTRLLNNFSWLELAILLSVLFIYSSAALVFFNAGVRRYKRMVD